MRKLTILVLTLAMLAMGLVAATAQDSGKVRIRVIHAASDAPAVDVFVKGVVVVRNLAYGQLSDIVEVDSGTYNLAISPTGSGLNAAVIGPKEVTLTGDTLITATGTVADGTLDATVDSSGIYSLDNIVAKVRVAHFSADAPAVDVFAKGVVVVRGLEFGQVSDWMDVEPGTINIAISPNGSGLNAAVIGPEPFTFVPNTWTTIAAIGLVGRETLTTKVITEDSAPIDVGNARLTIFHAAQGVPAVDVFANDNPLVTVLAYPGGLGSNDGVWTTEVPAGTYDLKITTTGAAADVLADLPETEIAANTDYLIAAIGTTDAPQVVVQSHKLPDSIIDVLAADGRFNTLVAAIEAAGLTSTLQTGGPFTVFAPSDGAFEAALSDLGMTADEILGNSDLLTSILTYHVLSGKVMADQLAGMESVTTLGGSDIAVSAGPLGAVLNGDTNVVRSNVEAANGVIHIINKVLIPSGS